MRCSPRKTKSTPTRSAPLRSAMLLPLSRPCSSSPAATHQRSASSPTGSPQRLQIRRPSPPPRARSMEQDQDPLASGEIHEGGAVVLQGSGRLSSTLVRRPPHPLAVPSLTPTIELPPPWQPWRSSFPSPTVAAEPSPLLVALVAVVLVHRRSPPAPTPMAGIDRPRLPLPYVANVCFRCFSHFKAMLQLFLWMLQK